MRGDAIVVAVRNPRRRTGPSRIPSARGETTSPCWRGRLPGRTLRWCPPPAPSRRTRKPGLARPAGPARGGGDGTGAAPRLSRQFAGREPCRIAEDAPGVTSANPGGFRYVGPA
ncbi:MAG TPA: hypothetical protein PLI31_06840 [Methanoregulaceae archaeon]|nr:hypothetical protein [Methanoregulaceae archaeon]